MMISRHGIYVFVNISMFDKRFFVLLWCCAHVLMLSAAAYHVQRIDSRVGLSNSAILSMYQDDNGFMWIGTYNGLNRYDGKFIESFGLDESINNVQSSNIIHNIQGAGDSCLWLSTYIGFNKFSVEKNKVVEHYPKYGYPFNLTSNGKDLTCLVAKTGYISVYDKAARRFVDVRFPGADPQNVLASFFDRNNFLWIITSSGQTWRIKISYKVSGKTRTPSIEALPVVLMPGKLNAAFEDNGLIHFVTATGDLYSYDIERKKNNYIHNIAHLTERYGLISSIISFHDDMWISFKGSGILKLVTARKYNEEILDMSTGVFCLKKDRRQDIMWVGSDGQGVHVYGVKTSIFNTILSAALPVPVRKPVRSIFTDRSNTLWIGTKGDGLIRIKDYEHFADQQVPSSFVTHYKTSDGLSSNQIFYIRNSEFHNLIWLGTEGPGLSYFSNADQRIHNVANNSGTAIRAVHSLVEQDDSTLWLATSTYGLQRIGYYKKNNELIVRDVKVFVFERNKKIVNDLFSISKDKNGILWIGSRGDGVIRFDMKSHHYDFITSGKQFNSPVDDILSSCRSNNSHFYFGSCAGLLKLSDNGKALVEVPNKTRSGMREMIHGMQEDKTGCLWMSTNRGLEKYNPINNIFHKYIKYTGLNVIEFSDNADYKCPHSDRIFFGGIDGVVWIEQNIPDHKSFSPEVRFNCLTINGVKENIAPYLRNIKNEKCLELSYDRNSFSVSFVAIDFIRGANIEYLYQLENYSNDWFNADEQNMAKFNSLPPGKYRLNVKYKYDVFDEESEYYSLPVVIRPPWFFSGWARAVYLLVCAILGLLALRWIQRRTASKQLAFNRQIIEKNKEELYETKMKFFTNITHEFLTPMTLIQGPCERILEYRNSDDYIKKYAGLLRVNIDRLQLLIHEIINFSKREEFGVQVCNIARVQLDEALKTIEMAFAESAERSRINYEFEYPGSLYWNTDISCFNKIMMNLVSNAFKYTPDEGAIKVKISRANDELVISVFNTGKGIHDAELDKVFDRFRILDNMEKNTYMDFSSRNGLGLAICCTMVRLLKGRVDVKSEVGKFAEFIVYLPVLEINTGDNVLGSDFVKKEFVMPGDALQPHVPAEMCKKKLLVVDDNKDIVWMISELMHDKYDIVEAFSAQEALDVLDDELPELIVADLMMPGELDGSDLVRRLKSNKFTAQIPVIIISAKNSMEDQITGLEYGADFYLTKPFNLMYLRTTIEKLVERKSALKDFYNSPLSAMELKSGQIMHHEDQQFLNMVRQIIDKNMAEGELRPELISEQLRMNPQAFYRKLKSISSLSPSEFIKRYRFSVAARLLLSSNMSVKEIIYKVGVNNRSYFYREFSKIYNTTPKEYRILSNPEDE